MISVVAATKRDQRMLLEAGQDHHELADEARRARQAGVGHREQHHERGEPRHHVGDAAVVLDHAAVHAVVEHADAGEHRARDEAVADHLHHRALQAQARGVGVADVAHQREGDEGAQGDEAHVRDRRIRDQLLHVVLHQRDQADVDHRDQATARSPARRTRAPASGTIGSDEAQEAVAADLQHDRGQDHRTARSAPRRARPATRCAPGTSAP